MEFFFEIKSPFEIKVVTVPWIDTPQQVLDETTFEQALLSMFQCHSNVLGGMPYINDVTISLRERT